MSQSKLPGGTKWGNQEHVEFRGNPFQLEIIGTGLKDDLVKGQFYTLKSGLLRPILNITKNTHDCKGICKKTIISKCLMKTLECNFLCEGNV